MSLAIAIGFRVGPKTIGRFEAGATVPNANTLKALALALKVKLEDFYAQG